jgi:DNA-binding MarR family transcriptional regulator
MAATGRVQLIQDVLGSAHIFSSAVNDLMQQRLHAVIGEQLTFSQIKLLKLVARTEAYNISQVAEFLGVSNAAASKAVDRLVRRNLLVRREAEGDRRAVELSLTEEGRGILDQYEAVTAEALEEIFGDVSADGLRQTAELLDKLSISLVDQDKERQEEACFRCSIYFREKCLLRARSGRLCHFHLSRTKEEKLTKLTDDGDGSRHD